jgi:integrase
MSGLRETELLNLRPEHIQDGCVFIKVAKSGKPRLVPIPEEALAITLPLDITYSTLRTYFEKARATAGLDHVRFHDLRHTYASWFLQSGGNLVALRDLLGHSTIAITADLYSHLETSHLKQGVAAMGKMLRKEK